MFLVLEVTAVIVLVLNMTAVGFPVCLTSPCCPFFGACIGGFPAALAGPFPWALDGPFHWALAARFPQAFVGPFPEALVRRFPWPLVGVLPGALAWALPLGACWFTICVSDNICQELRKSTILFLVVSLVDMPRSSLPREFD